MLFNSSVPVKDEKKSTDHCSIFYKVRYEHGRVTVYLVNIENLATSIRTFV